MKNFSVQSLYNWYRDAIRNPKYRPWVIVGSIAYLLSPFDISPDIFPIVGWLDDGIIAGLLVAEISQMMLERLNAGKTSGDAEVKTGAKTETKTGAAAAKDATTVDIKAEEV